MVKSDFSRRAEGNAFIITIRNLDENKISKIKI